MKDEKFIRIVQVVLAVAIIALIYRDYKGAPFKGAKNENAKDASPFANEDIGISAENADAQKSNPAISGFYPIMGKSAVTAQDMEMYFIESGAVYPSWALAAGGAASLKEFCEIYAEEAQAEGVRAEVAFAQTMKETGWLAYGKDAYIGQFNFAGLGVTGDGVEGNSFPDVRTGVRAQIQHLKAYATTESLNGECVDLRYGLVKRGSAPYVEWLGQQENPEGRGWAESRDYGYSIVEMIRELENI